MGGAIAVPVVVAEESINAGVMQVGKSWKARAMFRAHEVKGRGPSHSAAAAGWRDSANLAANE